MNSYLAKILELDTGDNNAGSNSEDQIDSPSTNQLQ